MINGVFFDYGGVLIPSAFSTINNNYPNINKERMKSLFYEDRLLVGDKGTLEQLLNNEYNDIKMSPNEVISFLYNCNKFDEVWFIARKLKEDNLTVGIISDCIAELGDVMRQDTEFTSLFYPILLSPEIKLSKKSKKIFDKASERVNVKSDNLLMIDDNSNNLIAAKEAGWHVILYKNPILLRKDLSRYGILKNGS